MVKSRPIVNLPPLRPKALLIVVVALVALLAAEVGTLGALDYSKGWLAVVDTTAATSPADPVRLSDFNWDPSLFANDPDLAPFVHVVRENCPNLGGLATAKCLSNVLAARFAHGGPTQELFDANFSPVAVLRKHLAGEEGHCVTRSGIIATALLASGIPARMVQLYVPSAGHNAIEVFEPSRGWIFFDPTYGGELRLSGESRSAVALIGQAEKVEWVQSATPVKTAKGEVMNGQLAYAHGSSVLLSGHLIYPEPWLYTRVGRKLAPAPFNAKFLVIGTGSWRLAFVRRFLLVSIVLTMGTLVLLPAAFAVRLRSRRRRSGAASAVVA